MGIIRLKPVYLIGLKQMIDTPCIGNTVIAEEYLPDKNNGCNRYHHRIQKYASESTLCRDTGIKKYRKQKCEYDCQRHCDTRESQSVNCSVLEGVVCKNLFVVGNSYKIIVCSRLLERSLEDHQKRQEEDGKKVVNWIFGVLVVLALAFAVYSMFIVS